MMVVVLLICLALFILAYDIDRLRQRVEKLEQQGEDE